MEDMRPGFLNKVSVKLILIISSVILLNLSIYTYYTVSGLKKDLTEIDSQIAFGISNIIKKSTRYSMLINRKQDIQHIINTIGTEAGVSRIRIYNKQGKIKYSTDSTDIGKQVDIKNLSCAICHSKDRIPAELETSEMTRVFVHQNGKKVLGLINPIKNESECYTGSCHYHQQDKKMLGVLDVMIETDQIDGIVEANIRNVLSNAVILTLLISVLTSVLIGIIINKPLQAISKGIEEITKGNLNYHIDIKAKNELANVASEFNVMSQKLDAAYKEIKEWNETLNLKVQEKNEELQKIYTQITQIEKLASLGTLSATVAHEINNPLEGILTYSKLIAKKIAKQDLPDNDRIIEFLNLIADEAARCGKIVKDLLLFSKQSKGEYSICDISVLLNKSLVLLNHHLELNNIELKEDFKNSSCKISCDCHKIEQALLAVLMNAIEAMPLPEGGKLNVSLAYDDSEVTIRIKDEGKGIPETDMPHIFEPFYSTKSNNKGTGLGLAVAYGIIVQHKGSISVEETSPKGTTFKISLPLHIS